MGSDLIDQFVADSTLHGQCTENGNWRVGNKAIDRTRAAISQLRKTADRGESALVGILGHPNEWVRLSASTHLLPVREDLARDTLKRLLTASTRHVAHNAKMVLQEWDKGNLREP